MAITIYGSIMIDTLSKLLTTLTLLSDSEIYNVNPN